MSKPFKGQKFQKLRKTQLELGTPFTDPLFPPTNSSLFFGAGGKNSRRIEWKRPGEICSDPKLFHAGISSGDVYQGQLGNCWFVAACSVLAGVKELWHKVIPEYKNQEWDLNSPKDYAGIFHFRFWRFGEWVDVVIDDLLPTTNGRLIYTHSRSKNEFWCALLEKAYAKVNGSYEALDGGNLSDALLDFTGGISETIDIKGGKYASDEAKRKELFKLLFKQKENHALMCCAVGATSKAEMEARTAVGLVKGHAYGITAVRNVNVKDTRLFSFLRGREKLHMVRLRNPWGNGIEWNGAFSDGSPEWQRISTQEREKLGLTFEEDGEFWMTIEDFATHFTEVSVCHLLNTSLFTFSRRWISASPIYGQWTVGPRGTATDRAGGCANNLETFLRNPQFCFDVDSDEEELIVQLSQPDVREKRHKGAENLVIGLHLLRVEANRNYRVHSSHLDVAGHSDYIKTRSVILRQTIGKGRYVVLPTTFSAGQTGDYLLRFFATCSVSLRELTRDVPKPSVWCCVSNPSFVTTITVRKVTGLATDSTRSLDLYCIISCEGRSVGSDVARNAQLEAVWNISGIFYRKSITQPITIEVWNRNVVRDTFLGQATIDGSTVGGRMAVKLDLKGKGKNSDQAMPGRLSVEYQTSDELKDL